MDYLKRFMRFINKENNIDYNKDIIINPFEFYMFFYTFAKYFCINDQEISHRWIKILPIINCMLLSFVCAIWVFSFVNNACFFNFPIMTETCTYLVVVSFDFLILFTTRYNVEAYHQLMEALKEDFNYICTEGNKYRGRFFINHRLTFKVCVLSIIFVFTIGFTVCISAFIAGIWDILTHDAYNQTSDRPLPYYVWWFNININRTPAYEIILTVCILSTIAHTFTYAFMMQNDILWIRQITSKADVIIWNIQDLLIDIRPARNRRQQKRYAFLIKRRMRRIVQMHQSMYRLIDSYSAVYKKLLIYELAATGPLIGLTAFCISAQLDNGDFNEILALICVAMVVVLFVPSCLCTLLVEKCQSVGYACLDIPFWNAGPVIRPYLIIIMQRSMRPLPIKVAGLKEVSLETYAHSISNAYKYFTLLRQANIDIV